MGKLCTLTIWNVHASESAGEALAGVTLVFNQDLHQGHLADWPQLLWDVLSGTIALAEVTKAVENI